MTREIAAIRERDPATGLPATFWMGVIATLGYDMLGCRTSLTHGCGCLGDIRISQVWAMTALWEAKERAPPRVRTV